MTTLKIKVTKDILEKSRNCTKLNADSNCAIALAIRDIFPKAYVGLVWVYPFGVYNGSENIDLPDIAQHFIRVFDNTEPVQRPLLREMEFEISIPDEVIEKINIEELRPLLTNHPTLELVN